MNRIEWPVIKTTTRKHHSSRGVTYVGRIQIYNSDQYLYSESTGIHRVSRGDAKRDATKLKVDRLLEMN